MAAYNAAYNAFVSYDRRALTPDQERWDSYEARLSRYALAESYHANTAYDEVNSFARKLKADHKLYRHIRSIYNPVARQLQIIKSYVYAGNLGAELDSGAIPFSFTNESLREPIAKVLAWSRWNEVKSQFVHQTALFGDSFIKIIDSPQRRRVRLELLNPQRVSDVRFDEVGNIRAIVIEYRATEDRPLGARAGATYQTSYEYRETLEKTTNGVRVQTYKDGKPFAYMTDDDGTPQADYYLPYDFVPVVKGSYSLSASGWWGVNCFQHYVSKLNELNDLASLLNDNIRHTVVPTWVMMGDKLTEEKKDRPDDGRDRQQIMYISKDAKVEPMVAKLDIDGALAAMNKVSDEIERDAPELALSRIREGSELTAPGVRAAYSDSIARVDMARAACDGVTTRAAQMAVSIGGIRRYEGFEAFNENSYDRGDMELSIKDRPVINDELGIQERIQALATVNEQAPAIQQLMLRDMGYTQEDIAQVMRGAALVTTNGASPAPALTNDGLEAFRLLMDGQTDGDLDTEFTNS